MNPVFQKTRELGETLLASEEFQLMKTAEENALKNAEAAHAMGQFLERKKEIQAMLIERDPDTEQLRRLSDEMDAWQEKMQSIDDVVRLTEARQAFSDLIEQVNKVLRFIVTGEMDNPEGDADGADGCGGGCGGCGGGCGHKH